tara:strand:+ start:379 stop:570 length:192 start_codon:yes stop_codon:yes gene_type:complete
MKFEKVRFDNLDARDLFLNAFFPDREQLEDTPGGTCYHISEIGVLIIDGRNLLFLMNEDGDLP